MISIPEPCSEDWSRMQAVDHLHRHCDSCAKNVIDFTSMSDDELVIFLQNRNEHMCGRFRLDQINKPYTKIPEAKHSSVWWKAALLLPLSFFAKQGKAQQDSASANDSITVTHDTTQTPAPDSALVANDSLFPVNDSTAIVFDPVAPAADTVLHVTPPVPQIVSFLGDLTTIYGGMVAGGIGMRSVPPGEHISEIISREMCETNMMAYGHWVSPFDWIPIRFRKPEPAFSRPDPALPLREKDPVAAANTVPPSPNTVEAPWYSVLLPVPFRRRLTGKRNIKPAK